MSDSTAITETIIERRTGWASLGLSELWQHRELAFFLAWRDIQVRYKQTILGAAWAVLQPLLMTIVFSIVFGRLGGMDRDLLHPYPVTAYATLLPWQFFSFCVSQGSQSLISSASIISKVYFPRLLVPIATVGVGIVDLGIASLLLIGLMAWYAVTPGLMLLWLPLLLIGLLIASIGVGTGLSALAVAYRDVRYVVPFMLQLWMFACPVVYPLAWIPPEWRWLYALNPMAGIIAGIRSALLGEPLDLPVLAISLTSAACMGMAGLMYFRKVERRFADIV